VKEAEMKKHAFGLFLFMGCVVFGASGCAKTEMVKKDEPIAQSTAAAKPVMAVPAPEHVATPAPVKSEVVSEQPAPSMSQTQEKVAASQAGELRVSLEKVYFDFDSPTLSKDARNRLSKNAEFMKKDHDVKVQIAGHCDERGSDEYNLALGEKRARAAMQYLTSLGIPADHLSVISYGKEKPADSGHDQAAWAHNRRDEFVVPNN
jgi:peptidoglycan-associated lipoprotein